MVDYPQKLTYFSDSHASFWSTRQDKEGKLQYWFKTFKRGSEKKRTEDSYFWAHTWVSWLCINRQYIVLQRSSTWRYVLSKAQANLNRILNLKMIFSFRNITISISFVVRTNLSQSKVLDEIWSLSWFVTKRTLILFCQPFSNSFFLKCVATWDQDHWRCH